MVDINVLYTRVVNVGKWPRNHIATFDSNRRKMKDRGQGTKYIKKQINLQQMYRDILEINKREISPYRHGYTAPTSKSEKTRLTIKILVRVKRKALRLYVVITREFPTMMRKAKA